MFISYSICLVQSAIHIICIIKLYNWNIEPIRITLNTNFLTLFFCMDRDFLCIYQKDMKTMIDTVCGCLWVGECVECVGVGFVCLVGRHAE